MALLSCNIITFNMIESIGFYKDVTKIGYYHIQYFIRFPYYIIDIEDISFAQYPSEK